MSRLCVDADCTSPPRPARPALPPDDLFTQQLIRAVVATNDLRFGYEYEAGGMSDERRAAQKEAR